ncbi:MAG: hypothetical protein AAFR73_08365 [Pseudomonadota bacterium]
MDTRWGLDLDMSAVRLMRRDGSAWVEDGVEKIDSPDIEERLERLVQPILDDGPVMLFLPREQILYTRVDLDASSEPKVQIERAMEGRTPYALDELAIDWDASGGDGVYVAAIARDTLDEAAAFAEVRDLKIAGYSTLFSRENFPRLPSFDGPNMQAPAPAAPPVAFATKRVPSRPPEAAVAAASVAATAKARFTPSPTAAEIAARKAEQPVIDVEDATPVVKVKAPQLPLDPGLPISAPNAPPRIRTDIAAASVSGHAASLTPPSGSLRVHKGKAPISTLAVFAVALLLTLGIAILVWNVLPMRPGSTATTPLETGALPNAVVEESAADAAPQEPTVETVETVAPPVPEFAPLRAADAAPLEDISTGDLAVPEPDAAPSSVALADAAPALDIVSSLATAPVAGAVPNIDRTTPEFRLPRMTASLQITAPFIGPEPDVEANSDDIFFSAFELPDPASDAIALPSVRGMTADPVPDVMGETVASALAEETADPVASAVAQALADALASPGGLIPTDLARALPETAPAPRPNQFTQEIERRQYGGRTRAELAELRPPARPPSAQSLAAGDSVAPPSELAIEVSLSPKTRPTNIAVIVTAARVQAEAARVSASASLATPDTSRAVEAALDSEIEEGEPENRAVRPRMLNIPTTANVARQATIENGIQLNRINLVGVYGAPTDRRALVRLSSGRYVKVKVGDRVDGGTVRQITDSELYYSKGNRTLSLQVPQG